MPRATFTARWVTAVKPSAPGQVDYFDTKPPGLGLRVAPKGRKTWFLMYRAGGRLRRLTIGTYPDLSLAEARALAVDARHTIATGADPAAQKQAQRLAPTMAEVATQYLERYAKVHKRSWDTDRRVLQQEVLPVWGRRKAQDITRRDVLALLDRLMERGVPSQANQVLAIVRKCFNWAISRDMLDHNPCVQVPAPSPEHQRDRVLTEEEIRAVWQACETTSPRESVQLQLHLLTAQRGGEVRTMRWEDTDLHTSWWTIPAHIAKNGLAHRVPLSPPAHALLQSLYAVTGQGTYVFPSPMYPARAISKAQVQLVMHAVRDCAGVACVQHDFRRTAASHMTSMGISRLVVGKILNHVEPGVTSVYDRHSYDTEKCQALDAWGRKVMALVTGERGKVIPLRREASE